MRLLLLPFFSIYFFSTILAQSSDAVKGKWLSPDQGKVIDIYEKDGKYYGKIIWLRDSTDEQGEPIRDVLNENAKKRSRKIIGTDMLLGYEWDEGGNEWDGGTIYNYETGSSYNSYMYLDENKNLRIKGYWWFLGFLGRTKTWTRISENFKASIH